MRPCSIEVEASEGKPITSPAAKMCGTAVLEGRRIDRDAAAAVGLQAAGVEVQRVGGADAAGGEQHHVAAHLAPVLGLRSRSGRRRSA